MPKIKLHPFFTRNKIAFLSLALVVMSVGVGWSITSLELTQLQDPTINLATTGSSKILLDGVRYTTGSQKAMTAPASPKPIPTPSPKPVYVQDYQCVKEGQECKSGDSYYDPSCNETKTRCGLELAKSPSTGNAIKDDQCLPRGNYYCVTGRSYLDASCPNTLNRCGSQPVPQTNYPKLAQECQDQKSGLCDINQFCIPGGDPFGSANTCKDVPNTCDPAVDSNTCLKDFSCTQSLQNSNIFTCQKTTANATGAPCAIREKDTISHAGEYVSSGVTIDIEESCVQTNTGKLTGYLAFQAQCVNGNWYYVNKGPGDEGNFCPRDALCKDLVKGEENYQQYYDDWNCGQTSQESTTARKAKKLNLDSLVKFFNSIF